jgi:hypothetical protein
MMLFYAKLIFRLFNVKPHYCTRVEVPITDHPRDFAPNLEKYKAAQILPCRRIEIKRTANFLSDFYVLN